MIADREGLILILSGPAGAGKTTFARMLCEAVPRCELSISATTRSPRGNEKDGEDYFFLSHEEFERRVQQDAFAEHASFSGNHYGTPKDFLDSKLRRGIHVVLDIEVKGAAQIRRHYPEAVNIFLLPPDPQTLARRLTDRRTDSQEEIARRLEIARNEILRMEEYHYLLINDDIDQTFSLLRHILDAEEHKIRGGEIEDWFGDRDPEEALKATCND
jgi:guanylate kinase